MTHAPAVWYLMRSTGIVALVLLTLSFGLGVANTNRWRPHGSRLYVTTEIHRYVSLLAVAFVAVHVATAVIDPDAQVRTLAAVWPFGPPFSLALGVLSLDLLAAVVLTSLGRRRLPFGAWRAIHWSAYAAWPLAFRAHARHGHRRTPVVARAAGPRLHRRDGRARQLARARARGLRGLPQNPASAWTRPEATASCRAL